MKIRNITEQDLSDIRELVKKCYPLDFHTLYSYWIIAKYFSEYSYILEERNKKIGFITSLKLPEPDMLFIWQIGIIKEYRGKKLSHKLIGHLFGNAYKDKIHKFQLTIDPANKASFNAFKSYLASINAEMVKIGDLDIVDKYMQNREYEIIYQITLPENFKV